MHVTDTTTWPGWFAALLCLGVFCAGCLLYWLVRRRRYRQPVGLGLGVRVQGRLLGRVGALARGSEAGLLRFKTLVRLDPPSLLEVWLSRAEEVLLVEQEGRCIPVIVGAEARGARSGTFVTADGLPVTLFRDETLYRQPTAEPALLAGRLVLGQWPELRPPLPVAIALIWLVGLVCWLFATAPAV